MDGLDIYVGDYTQADPMPAGMLERLAAVYTMLDPVEPPPEEAKAAGSIAPPAGAVPITETTPSAEAPLVAGAASVAEAEIPIEATAIDDATVSMTADPSGSGETGADDADAAKPA